jgi:hypothetical protein
MDSIANPASLGKERAASLLAGFVSGACATTLGHPLDTLKVRMQVQTANKSHNTAVTAVNAVSSVQGWLPAARNTMASLYRGLLPPMLTAGALQATYFAIYERVRPVFTRRLTPGNSNSSELNRETNWHLDALLAGGVSGTLISLLTNPVSLVKVRLQTSYSTSSLSPSLSLFRCMRDILSKQGIRGFYVGFTSMVLMEGIGRAGYFHAYELLKHYMNPDETDEKKFSVRSRMIAASCSGVYSWFIIYPLDVAKSRIQCNSGIESNHSLREVLKTIYREAGIRGLYRGLGFTLLRSAPVASISLPLYEVCKHSIGALLHQIDD